MLSHGGKAGSLIVVGDVEYRNAQDILNVEVPTRKSGNGIVNAVAFNISRWASHDSVKSSIRKPAGQRMVDTASTS